MQMVPSGCGRNVGTGYICITARAGYINTLLLSNKPWNEGQTNSDEDLAGTHQESYILLCSCLFVIFLVIVVFLSLISGD